MFDFFFGKKTIGARAASRPALLLSRCADFDFGLEALEGRRLLSAVLEASCTTTTGTTDTGTTAALTAANTTMVPASSLRFATAASTTTTTSAGTTKIAFADAPSAAQNGLSALAQGVTIPTAQVVKQITRRDGTTIYSTAVSVNGRRNKLTVDSDGNPLAGKIAFSAAPTVVQTGLQAQLSGVTIADDQVVSIRERRGGTVVYSTSVNTGGRAKTVAVDADGTAVKKNGRILKGGTTETFADATTAVQNGLQALAQGTAIGSDQIIDIFTFPDSTKVFSALISIDGEAQRIAVAEDGTAMEGEIQFGDAPSAVQTGLQALATGGTIPDTQLVRISTRPGANATSIYSTSVELSNTATIIAVDEDGTAVTLFGGGGEFGHHGFGGVGGVTDRTTVDFSTLPSAAQIALEKLAGGVTFPDTLQVVSAILSDGTVVYSTVANVNGRLIRIAADANGNFRAGEISFVDAPSVVQTNLQTLAGKLIAADQTVRIVTRRDGTTVYSTAVTTSNNVLLIAVDSTGATISDGTTSGTIGGDGGGGHGGHRQGMVGGGGFGGSGFADAGFPSGGFAFVGGSTGIGFVAGFGSSTIAVRT